MSGLGSLFSGMSADNNDALKYSAPKEPKQRSAKPAPAPATPSTPAVISATVAAAPVARAPGPSKIMASAAVRLFKVNPSTGGYDAVEGGGLLGCVMMGTGFTFQILVYNGQKVPQATVAINGTFDFTLRDLYMSFADAAGNQWSLLFDSVEVMTVFVRTVVATVVHCATHNPDTVDSSTTIRRALPRTEPADEEDTMLAQGMAAGIYLTAWEMQEVNDYPGDVVAGAPLKRVQAPDDVLKIKLSPTDEQIGGLSEAIVGLRKGDRLLIGVPPQIFYSTTSTSATSDNAIIDATKRTFPGSWVLLEVEIAKIKSEGKKKDKSKNTVPFDTVDHNPSSHQPESPVQRLAKRNNSASFDDGHSANPNNNTNNSGNSEIAARMARVAQGTNGGANSQLAGIMNNQNHQRSPNSGNSGDRKTYNNQQNNNSYNNGDQYNRNNNTNHNNNNSSNNSNRQGGNNNNSHNNNYQNNDNYSNDGRNYHNNNNSNNNNNPFQENRLAVVEGQGVRSYYDAEDEQYNNNNNYNDNNNNYRNNSNNPNNSNNSNYNRPPPVPVVASVVDSLTSTGLIQLHQSVAAVQQSMLQLHTKLDQVGTQVTNSAALQQQALVTTTGAGAGAGAGMGGIQGMNNPYMNPLQQQQMQMQLLQQQQQQMFMNNMHVGGGLGGMGAMNQLQGVTTSSGSGSVQRIKTEDMISTLQVLLNEYERHTSTSGGSGGGAAEVAAAKEEAKVAAKALRATIDKLEEKNDTLQARYDKLMTEKSDLMEKYMEQFQTGSSATNKLYQAQQELDSLRAQQGVLQGEVEALRANEKGYSAAAAAASSGGSSKEKDQEQKNLIAELQHQVMALQMEAMEHKQATDRATYSLTTTSSELSALQALHAQQTLALAAARAETAALHDALESAKLEGASATAQVAQYEEEERANREKIAELQAELDSARAGAGASNGAGDAAAVQELQNEVSELKTKLAAAESTTVSLNHALDAVAAQAQATNDSTATTIADLQQQLTVALAAAANSGSTTSKADAEELKNIMQEVYLKACEVFDPEAPDSAEVQYSANDIVKRLRGVLKRVTTERNTA